MKTKTVSSWTSGSAALIGGCLGLLILAAHAQGSDPTKSWNPYLIQAIIDQTTTGSGSTLLPVEFNGTGFARFDVGNTGSTDLHVEVGEEMRLVITLSKGVPDNVDPLAALSGDGVAWFKWEYYPDDKTYYATQKEVIPGKSRKTIIIAYKVAENSFLAAQPTISNGFNVNLQPPAYTGSYNDTIDDSVSSYTYVEAKDYGDAPSSYGEAVHSIDVSKATGGRYQRYMYLGALVDPETTYQASLDALGDDKNESGGLNVDDEDGLVFPALMVQGQTYSVPVVMTLWDWNPELPGAVAQLRVWVDWDRSATFGSTTERIYNQDHSYLGEEDGAWTGPRSFTEHVSLVVPPTAPDGIYYVRVRFGPVATPLSIGDYGEIEDYLIQIGIPPVAVNDEKLNNPVGSTVTVSALGNDSATSSKTLDSASVQIVDTANPGDPLEVPGEGTWTVNTTTGEITFTPETGFTGDPTPISYTVKDSAGLVSNQATVTITYGSPTAARLAYFHALSTEDGAVQLTWGTLAEAGILGFKVDRSTANGGWERITSQLIEATGSDQRPQSYRLVDERAPALSGVTYRLLEIDQHGKEVVLAEATVQAGMTAGLAVQGDRLSLNLRGKPGDTVTVETAPTVIGPWTRWETVTLNEKGVGKLDRAFDTKAPFSFYRILSE